MTDIITKIRREHTFYVTMVAGIILLFLVGCAIGLATLSRAMEINRVSDIILSQKDADHRPEELGVARCFAFSVDDEGVDYFPAYTSDLEYYEDLADDIVATAIQKKDGLFKVDEYKFSVTSQETDDGTTFIVYDSTIDAVRMRTSILFIASLYVVGMLVIWWIAYLFSGKTTKPLRDAFDLQKDLIANASHELKTPLAIISADLAVMNSDKTTTVEDNEKWIASISGQVDRMSTLVKNMLELSKLEKSAITKSAVDFSSVVESACLGIEVIAFEKGINLKTDIQQNIFTLGEKDTLERLALILLDNALKYCSQKGEVRCTLTVVGKKLHLSVANTGEIISREDAEHVFDRFYRSDSARQNPDNKSFGLGLAIAQTIVKSHGGTISCHGVENYGTIFHVYLPVHKKKLDIR